MPAEGNFTAVRGLGKLEAEPDKNSGSTILQRTSVAALASLLWMAGLRRVRLNGPDRRLTAVRSCPDTLFAGTSCAVALEWTVEKGKGGKTSVAQSKNVFAKFQCGRGLPLWLQARKQQPSPCCSWHVACDTWHLLSGDPRRAGAGRGARGGILPAARQEHARARRHAVRTRTRTCMHNLPCQSPPTPHPPPRGCLCLCRPNTRVCVCPAPGPRPPALPPCSYLARSAPSFNRVCIVAEYLDGDVTADWTGG